MKLSDLCGMTAQNNGPTFGERMQAGKNFSFSSGVQMRSWFVQKEQRGILEIGTRNGNTLRLPT